MAMYELLYKLITHIYANLNVIHDRIDQFKVNNMEI